MDTADARRLIHSLVAGEGQRSRWASTYGELLRWAEQNPAAAVATLSEVPRQDLQGTAVALRAYSTDHYHRRGLHEPAFLLSNMAALMQMASLNPAFAIEYWIATIADPLRLSQNERILRVGSLLRHALEQSDASLDLWGAYFERLGSICAAYDDQESARRFRDAASSAFYAYEADFAGTEFSATANLHEALGKRLDLWCKTRLVSADSIAPLADLADGLDACAQENPRDPNTGTWKAIAGNTRTMLIETYVRLAHREGEGNRYIDLALETMGGIEQTPDIGSDYSQRKAAFARSIIFARTGDIKRARALFQDAFVSFQERGLYLSAGLDDHLRQYDLLHDDSIKKHGKFRQRQPLFVDRNIVEWLASPPPRILRSIRNLKPRGNRNLTPDPLPEIALLGRDKGLSLCALPNDPEGIDDGKIGGHQFARTPLSIPEHLRAKGYIERKERTSRFSRCTRLADVSGTICIEDYDIIVIDDRPVVVWVRGVRKEPKPVMARMLYLFLDNTYGDITQSTIKEVWGIDLPKPTIRQYVSRFYSFMGDTLSRYMVSDIDTPLAYNIHGDGWSCYWIRRYKSRSRSYLCR